MLYMELLEKDNINELKEIGFNLYQLNILNSK